MTNHAGQEAAIEVLLIEDSPGDVRLIHEGFKTMQASFHLSIARDGEEGVAFLGRQGKFHAAPRPRLILLDLNLPRKDGREVLAAIKGDASLRTIPVVVLSTSSSKADVRRSYELLANGYVTKPPTLKDYLEAVRNLANFWFRTATLPPDDQ